MLCPANNCEYLVVKVGFDDNFPPVGAEYPAWLDDPLIPIVKGEPHPRQQTSTIAARGADKDAVSFRLTEGRVNSSRSPPGCRI